MEKKNYMSGGFWLHMDMGVHAVVKSGIGIHWVHVAGSDVDFYLMTTREEDAQELAAVLNRVGKPPEERE